MATTKRVSMRASVAAGGAKRDVLAPLKAAEIVTSKSALPAELIATILDYLSIPDLLRCARVSKRLKEMVYEDGRWIRRLKLMGCWDEAAARRESEKSSRRKLESLSINHQQGAVTQPGSSRNINIATGKVNPGTPSSINSGVDSKNEHDGKSHDHSRTEWIEVSVTGSATQTLSPNGSIGSKTLTEHAKPRSPSVLQILSAVRSIRSLARQEYGRVYKALAPFYFDLLQPTNATEPMLFRIYPTSEQQAKMLAQLNSFARSDITPGGQLREEKVRSITDIFENAVLHEFELGLQASDDQRMQKYAQVLVMLNGGQKAADLFIHKHPLLTIKAKFGDPMDCINNASSGVPSLEPSYFFFERISTAVNEESKVIDRVFPESIDVFLPFLDRLGENLISGYVTTLLVEVHIRNVESYLKVVPGIYEQARAFVQSVQPSQNSTEGFPERSQSLLTRLFEPHLELYLQEELDLFRRKSNAEVDSWEQKLSEEDATKESFFMSNVNRQAVKKDFMSSFKKVVMMPVNVLPSFPLSAPFGSGKSSSTTSSTADIVDQTPRPSSRMSTKPVPSSLPIRRTASPGLPSGSTAEAPTTELAAKAAIMNSRLEGIRSLFSIEVALNLTHAAKASLDRAALFVGLGGKLGKDAKERCETIFILLLQILSSKHIKPGFDKAVDHLSKYNPREVSEHNQPGVAPLVTFLELVNVGDLILQMIDVFYEQELVAKKLADRTDFLAAPVKEKKRFEQMLDERVAAGLNKGIDVLMEEVEYLLSTTQQPTDFNPQANTGSSSTNDIDIGPTVTAKRVVEVVSSHTTMLQGTTDKNMLDVFNQEVGLRLFTALCKHIKRQRISIDGSIKLISDMTHYSTYITTLRNPELLQYFKALRELSQIYLIDCSPSSSRVSTTTSNKSSSSSSSSSSAACKDLATVIADPERFHGVFRAEEVYEFVERRADWYLIKRGVERAMYGVGCGVM